MGQADPPAHTDGRSRSHTACGSAGLGSPVPAIELRIPVRLHAVAASVRETPDKVAGFGLVKLPEFGLFRLVVPSAQACEVALACSSALVVGDRMVLIALHGGPAATREATRAPAHVDDVL